MAATGWAAALGSALALGLLVVRWWLSPAKRRERAFENDEAERNEFREEIARGDLHAARSRWLRRMRQNRAG